MIMVKISLEIFRICYVLIFHVHEDNKNLKTYLLVKETSHKTSFLQKESDQILLINLFVSNPHPTIFKN